MNTITTYRPVASDVLCCPRCHVALANWECSGCRTSYPHSDGIGDLRSTSALAERYREIGAFYDNLYRHTGDTWEQLASRGEDFNRFTANLVRPWQPSRILEIGCGKGFLLSHLPAPEKFGTEISRNALLAAVAHSNARLVLGCAEELPFCGATMDVVVSIGVMTHLLDDAKATREVRRVLRPTGHYLLGIYVRPSWTERLLTKIAEARRSRRPWMLLLRALRRRIAESARAPKASAAKPEQQPVERLYEVHQLEGLLERSGFKIRQRITKRVLPDSPLPGSHFRIYLLDRTS